jgi:hypothetical protein
MRSVQDDYVPLIEGEYKNTVLFFEFFFFFFFFSLFSFFAAPFVLGLASVCFRCSYRGCLPGRLVQVGGGLAARRQEFAAERTGRAHPAHRKTFALHRRGTRKSKLWPFFFFFFFMQIPLDQHAPESVSGYCLCQNRFGNWKRYFVELRGTQLVLKRLKKVFFFFFFFSLFLLVRLTSFFKGRCFSSQNCDGRAICDVQQAHSVREGSHHARKFVHRLHRGLVFFLCFGLRFFISCLFCKAFSRFQQRAHARHHSRLQRRFRSVVLGFAFAVGEPFGCGRLGRASPFGQGGGAHLRAPRGVSGNSWFCVV